MRNTNNRTKMILAIVGVVVVVAIVVGVVMNQVSGGALFGSAADLVITPSNPTIAVGDTVVLTVNATYNCNWFVTTDPAVTAFVGDTKEVKSVTLRGHSAGMETVETRCGIINVNKVTTNVRVIVPTPVAPK